MPGAERLAAEVGVEFDHPDALELFREAGQTVEDTTVRFDPGFLRAQAAHAPSRVPDAGAQPERETSTIGGDHMVFAPAQGPPFVRVDGERRDGTMADLELAAEADAANRQPRHAGPQHPRAERRRRSTSRHLLRALAAIRLTDRVWSGEPSSDFAAADCIRMAEIVFGGREAIEETPVHLRELQRQLAAALRQPHARGDPQLRRRWTGGDRDAVPPDGRDGAGVRSGRARAAERRGARGDRTRAARPPGQPVRARLVPVGDRHEERLPGIRWAGVGARAVRLGSDRAPARAAVALRRRHAHVEPGGRLPGGVRGDEHAAGGVPRRRERVLAVGGLARGRARDVVREVRGGHARCSTCCCTSSRRSTSTTRASPTARTSRSGRAVTSSARSTRSSASATASGGRRSRRRRTSTAGRRTARSSTRSARPCGGRSCSRPTSSLPLDEAIEEELVEFVERRAVELGDPITV